ncbi:arylamine N-acetyltransferase [Chryseobacterium candidae]|uniref:Arylamine N-acetyltransferase n=1 Tax=Chryseobacterium candidae TaxID=1978493 RepID=A0ABY2R7Y2_9FLAO|nr:arylamine N-acetyltransferase [Chryseobacterium candidae]
MNTSDLENYLERIHFSGTPELSMETLRKIHQLQPKFIPFENIDSYTGIVPSLNVDDIFRKLVIESRGGYCYEQNLLLSEVLKTLGFHVKLQLGRVVWGRQEDSIAAQTHLLLIVDFEGEHYVWIADLEQLHLLRPYF